jgi:hypothetical protein
MSGSCEYCGSNIKSHKKYCDKDCYGKDISNSVFSTCKTCGNEFEHEPSRDRKYCSKDCFGLNKRNRTKLPCENCGKVTEFQQNEINRAENNFCSQECNIEHQKNNKKECLYCSKEFRPKNTEQNYCSRKCSGKDSRKRKTTQCANCSNSVTRRKKYLSKHNNVFCSDECNSSWRSENSIFATNNPNKKDGKYGGFGENWIKWRDKIRERANESCENCGKTSEENGRSLSVHHIEPRSNFINSENRAVEDSNNWHNLVALCRSCHMKAEHGEITVSNNV